MSYQKYRAIRTEVDGIKFASKAEAKRYGVLKMMQMAGEITGLKLQPKFSIVVYGQKVCDYVADFQYVRHGEAITEDVKGMKTPIYRLKKRLMLAVHGIEIKETR